MNRYLILHQGFEKPTPEIMDQWKAWFEKAAGCTVDQGGFHGQAVEISQGGEQPLGMDREALTGYSIIEAESFDAALALARENPFVTSIRVYEIK